MQISGYRLNVDWWAWPVVWEALPHQHAISGRTKDPKKPGKRKRKC